MPTSSPSKPKAPQPIFSDSPSIFAFPPNRETLGGTAYLILEKSQNSQPQNILIDCPALNDTTQTFIQENGGIHTLFITHRGGIAQVPNLQKAFNCRVLIQEQEAYLLPTVKTETFHREQTLSQTSRVLWNPGHSPGSSSLYHTAHGGILFTGRHLLPNKDGNPAPLRLSKTFHWPRQIRHAQQLLTDFTPQTLSHICPGASTGYLRGQKKITQAYQKLQKIDWKSLTSTKAII